MIPHATQPDIFRDMHWQYTNPIWKTTWSVDSDGIHEQRSGRVVVSIGWNELEHMTSSCARSTTGKCVSLKLDRRERKRFLHHAFQQWQKRHPERCLRNRQRTKRSADLAAYVWLPVVTLGPFGVFYILNWMLGQPNSLSSELEKINRLFVLVGLSVGASLFAYRFWNRKFDEKL